MAWRPRHETTGDGYSARLQIARDLSTKVIRGSESRTIGVAIFRNLPSGGMWGLNLRVAQASERSVLTWNECVYNPWSL